MIDLTHGVSLLSVSAAQSVVVDGRVIPRLTVSGSGERLTLVLDGRFGCDGTPGEVAKWARMIAQALAIGAGYPSLSADAHSRPFAPEVRMIGDPSPALTVIDGGGDDA